MKIIVVLGILFVGRYQPIIIIFRIILLTLFLAYYVYISVGRFWYRYIILLVMLRGVLILFTYIVRLLPNERFEILSLAYIRLVCLRVGIFNILRFINFNYDGMKIWWGLIWFLNIFIFIFLLIIIIIVVWLTLLEKVPIRIL